jgi:hypothetical protein
VQHKVKRLSFVDVAFNVNNHLLDEFNVADWFGKVIVALLPYHSDFADAAILIPLFLVNAFLAASTASSTSSEVAAGI